MLRDTLGFSTLNFDIAVLLFSASESLSFGFEIERTRERIEHRRN